MLDEISKRVSLPPEIVIKDGIKHCAKCGKPVEVVAMVMDKEKRFNCICDCMRAEDMACEERFNEEEKARNKSICFSDKAMQQWTFENDDMAEPKLSAAMKKYADDFQKYLREGKGLLLYGNIGSGKSYYAACIANRLIDNGYRVKMTNFQTIINQLNNSWEGRNEYINQLCSYSLLILDDLGTERQSEYMQEQVFNIVNARYVTGKPIIVTTNLNYKDLFTETDIGRKRIYDRILERTLSVEINSVSRRMKKAINNDMRKELGL